MIMIIRTTVLMKLIVVSPCRKKNRHYDNMWLVVILLREKLPSGQKRAACGIRFFNQIT